MKKMLFLCLCFSFLMLNVMAQTLDYYPPQKPNVSDDDYSKGIMILEETYKQIREQGKYSYVDYWNLGIAHILLQDNTLDVKEMMKKSRETNPTSFAKVFTYPDKNGIENRWREVLSEEEYKKIIEASEKILEKVKPDADDISS